MKKIRLIRLICVIVLAVILIVASLFILIPRRNDSSSGRAALLFVHEDIASCFRSWTSRHIT